MARKSSSSIERIGMALIGFSTIIVAVAVNMMIPSASAEATSEDPYALIMEYKGDAYALDTGMTFGDCFAALPRNDASKGATFACERDPA